MAKKKTSQTAETLELDYQLAELPSSQHRAGLAGLVLMVKWLERQGTNKGICELNRLDDVGATLRINELGLEALFDEIYAASLEEREEPKLRTKKNSDVVKPPIREVTREIVKRGKVETKTFYVYPVYRPKGALLADLDPTAKGLDGEWIKLWRDMYFSILRGRDKQRLPFKARANNERTDDAAKTWDALRQPTGYAVKMPSTFFMGAQDTNAEDVPFKDKARDQFLLNFWPYVAQIYVPRIVNNKGEIRSNGFALAIPDVSDLAWFCEELPNVLRNRGVEVAGYRPRDCIVDLSIEGALDILSRLRERVAVIEGDRATGSLVLGIDIVHADKPADSVEIKGLSRVDPEAKMIDEFVRLRRALWNPLFKRQRLVNLVNERPWFTGFDKLLSGLPYKELFAEQADGFKHFRHDVQESFKHEAETVDEETQKEMTNTEELTDTEPIDSGHSTDLTFEELIYRLVGTYISRKLKNKYELEWSSVKSDPKRRGDYEQSKEKIARDAFLAVRSRTGAEFADYFASTLCSVPQHMGEQHFETLARALHDETDKVRTLTMLALSARG
jgi:CRISPR-associated protein Cmx8